MYKAFIYMKIAHFFCGNQLRNMQGNAVLIEKGSNNMEAK